MKSCKHLLMILSVLIGILCWNPYQAASKETNPDEGVETFDGISYTLYYKDETLPTRFVTAVTSNKSGDTFVGTKDVGIFRFSKDTSKRQWFNKFPVTDKTQVAIHQMVFDEKNNQLFAATTAGVFRISNAPDFNDASCRLVDKAPAKISISLALDAGNGLWVGTPAGLYDPSGTLFTSKDGLPSDMVLSLKGDSDKKKRYFLQTGILPTAEHSDLTEGLSSALHLHKKFGYYPLKMWQGKTSELSDEDWNRTASYLGKQMLPNDTIKFIGLLAVDPWLFIPCIHLDDIPALKSADENGMPDMSDTTISAYENYSLPVVPEGSFLRETYPQNHPQSRLRQRKSQ